MIQIRPCSAFDSDVSALIDELDELQVSLYPPESNHLVPKTALLESNYKLFGAFDGDHLMGIGAGKKANGYGELKRFFVKPSARGNGAAECLVAAVEKWFIDQGLGHSCLETGIHQHAALRFYEKVAYNECLAFGEYKPDPLSTFMTKPLTWLAGSSESRESFFCVVFTSQLKTNPDGYAQAARRMEELALRQPGLAGINSHRTNQGRGFTASYWRNLESIKAWKDNAEHIEVQRSAHSKFYDRFRIYRAQITTNCFAHTQL